MAHREPALLLELGSRCRGSTVAKALGKRLFYETVGLDTDAAYARAVPAMAASALDPDAREWMHAFLEKRPPVYPSRR